MRCTDAPTQPHPERTKKSAAAAHSVSQSWPAVTFCQSTTTTPVKRFGSAGRRTTIRVRYGIAPIAVALSDVVGTEKRVAVPEMKYSCSTYPTLASFIGVE